MHNIGLTFALTSLEISNSRDSGVIEECHVYLKRKLTSFKIFI